MTPSLSITIAERHAREMYKAAATLAKQAIAQGGIVWWSAGKLEADCYGLDVHLVSDAGRPNPVNWY